MSLEDLTGTKFIDALVITNPDGLDDRSEGDDHIRGIKNVILDTFGPIANGVGMSVAGTPSDGLWINKIGVPAGTILDYGGAAVPAGFLKCDGAAVSRTTYAALYAALGGAGSPWGQGDASTTFNVPELRRRVTIGSGGTAISGPANTVGAVGGAETDTLTEAQLPAVAAHVHQEQAENNTSNTAVPMNIYSGIAGTNLGLLLDASQSVTLVGPLNTVAGGGFGSGQAHNNMQPSAVVLKIIKT